MDFSVTQGAQAPVTPTVNQTPNTQPADQTQAAPAPVVPPTVEPVKPESEQSQSQLVSALARERKQRLDASKRVKQEQAYRLQLEQRLAAMEQQRPMNPIEALQRAGFTYEQATNFVLNDNKITPELQVQAIQQKIEKVEQSFQQQQEAAQKAAQQQAQAEYQQTVETFQEDIGTFVSEHPDDYELISLHDAQAIIYDTIEQHWDRSYKTWLKDKTGPRPKMMSIKDAADQLEKYLEDRVEKSYQTKKFQAKVKPKDAPVAPNDPSTGFQPKSLNNSLTSSAAASFLPAATEEDRMKRALAKLS